MRILTGKFKGKNILMPKGIRPTQNMVRKALFDILGDLEGVSFLELFAGSGSIGFEALSRGVKDLVLVETNRDCQLAINKNIASLKVKSCVLYPGEAENSVKLLYGQNRKFDVIFLDPPYYKDMAKKILQTLSAYDILAPDGLLVAQHFKRDSMPETIEGKFKLFKRSFYGDTVLSFYDKNKGS